jgi:phosphoglycolate phosphatase-like HAD superfamily hydrolase
MSRLTPVWFDIDGTLLHTRAGLGAFRRALHKVYGWDDTLESVVFAGNTDLQVLMDLSLQHAGETDHALPDRHTFFMHMAAFLDEALRSHPPQVIPGAPALVRALAARSDVLLGLLTGNARDCAMIKLKHVNLHEAFHDGGFGDQDADRNVLATLAQERLQNGLPAGMCLQSGWVVGDTPRDVRAAKTIGARCLGVASGAASVDQLLEVGADAVVEDLADTERLVDLLTCKA